MNDPTDRVEEADLDTYAKRFLIPKLTDIALMEMSRSSRGLAESERRIATKTAARQRPRKPRPLMCAVCGGRLRDHEIGQCRGGGV